MEDEPGSGGAADSALQPQADPGGEVVPLQPQEEVSQEVRPLIAPKGPITPTQAEIDEHEASSHVNFRNWCRHCLRARAAANPHL